MYTYTYINIFIYIHVFIFTYLQYTTDYLDLYNLIEISILMMAFSARVPGLDFSLEESSDQQTWEVFFGCVCVMVICHISEE